MCLFFLQFLSLLLDPKNYYIPLLIVPANSKIAAATIFHQLHNLLCKSKRIWYHYVRQIGQKIDEIDHCALEENTVVLT